MTGEFREKPAILITASGLSDKGLARSENQDRLLIADLSRDADQGGLRIGVDDDTPANYSLALGPAGLLALVADGMGGPAGGELAAKLAAETILSEMESAASESTNHDLALRLRSALETANTQIHHESLDTPNLWGMGTTATVALILGDELHLAQIGDSRAYLIRGGTANQLTHDQSRVQALIDAGLLTPESAAESPHRHIILQALGPEPEIEVDLTDHTLRRGDTLVLSSDGLHGLVDDDEIARLIREMEPDPARACRALIDLANERGGPDNITVIIMHFDGDGLPPAPAIGS